MIVQRGSYKIQAFEAGKCFYNAACDIVPKEMGEQEDDGHWFVPSVVNAAFACELYLKSLLSNGTDTVEGHNLFRLFQKLNDAHKESIMNAPEFKGDNNDFLTKLKLYENIFVEWRYYFEPDKSCSVDVIFLGNFGKVLHDLAEKELNTGLPL